MCLKADDYSVKSNPAKVKVVRVKLSALKAGSPFIFRGRSYIKTGIGPVNVKTGMQSHQKIVNVRPVVAVELKADKLAFVGL